MRNFHFSHIYDKFYGWSGTTLKPSDFASVELLGENRIDGVIYLAFSLSGKRYIFKDNRKVKKMV